MNIPNYLTIVRILLTPLLVLLFYTPFQWAPLLTALVFGVAAATDWLDGYVARRRAESTKLGAFLDPVADKLLVVVTLVMLVGRFDAAIVLPALVIISREIVVSALRERMAELGSSSAVSVSALGKIKMVFQVAAILLLLWVSPDDLLRFVGYLLLYAAALLTVWSMMLYLRDAWPTLVSSAQQGTTPSARGDKQPDAGADSAS